MLNKLKVLLVVKASCWDQADECNTIDDVRDFVDAGRSYGSGKVS